jgi:hypothetical protein
MSSSADATPSAGESVVGFVVIAAVLLVVLGFCLHTVVGEHSQAAAIDAARVCGSGTTRGCVSRQHGVVKSADEAQVDVAYDDGRRSAGLGSVGDTYPERGTRVVLESWNGHFVSALDPVSEHRYRGTDWPKAWNGGALLGVVVASFILLWIGAAAGEEYVKRRRGETA